MVTIAHYCFNGVDIAHHVAVRGHYPAKAVVAVQADGFGA